MNLAKLRGRLEALAARVPGSKAARMMTSEEAIIEAAELVRQARAEGAAVPDDGDMSPAEEGALVARALAQTAEYGNGCHNRCAVGQRR